MCNFLNEDVHMYAKISCLPIFFCIGKTFFDSILVDYGLLVWGYNFCVGNSSLLG